MSSEGKQLILQMSCNQIMIDFPRGSRLYISCELFLGFFPLFLIASGTHKYIEYISDMSNIEAIVEYLKFSITPSGADFLC
jgi:hypothetical protein